VSSNRGDAICDCGLDFERRPEVGRRKRSDLFDGQEYQRQTGVHRSYQVTGYQGVTTLFGKIVCPLCRTEFVGWFREPEMPKYDGPEWRVYDTSYWSTYNDEPGKADVAKWRDPVEVLKMLEKLT
jgi:hypothetical protein